MKISGIDKDLEAIIYYLDSNGFKPFASCDGVVANHKDPNDVGDAYISFLKSPKIISLMAEFLKDNENFRIQLASEGYFSPHEQYGNIISGTTYAVKFPNKYGEKTQYFESVIRNLVERETSEASNEQRTLGMLEQVLEENSNSDLQFKVYFNDEYQPHMKKTGRINQLAITTKAGNEIQDGNILINTERDMEVLADILSKKYNISRVLDNAEEYPENEFIMSRFDKSMCSVYFTDEHFDQILDQIQYIRQIAHTLPTFESKEWIGSDEELFDEYYNEESEVYDEEEGQTISDKFDETPLSKRENMLSLLEQEADLLLREEQRIPELSQVDDERI